jgi:acyl-CoA dehydrogenase
MNTLSDEQRGNMDYMLAVGKMFTLIVYAQLIAENCKLKTVDSVVTDQVFSVMVRDFAELAFSQLANFKNSIQQEKVLRDMLKTPNIDAQIEQSLWDNFVAPLNGAYIMNS